LKKVEMPLATARGEWAFLCAGCLLAVEKVGRVCGTDEVGRRRQKKKRA
jgi:hypothetical protein